MGANLRRRCGLSMPGVVQVRKALALCAAIAMAGPIAGARAGTPAPGHSPVPPRPLGVDRSVDPADTRPRAETVVAVDPSNPQRVAVVAIQFTKTIRDTLITRSFVSYDTVWISGDAGRTFRASGPLPVLHPQTPAANDPWLAWDPHGPLYASYSAFTGGPAASPEEGLYVARSDDGGRTWRPSRLVEGFTMHGQNACDGPDRSTVAVDPVRGWVYVTWVQYADPACSGAPNQAYTQTRWARSLDGGRTFSRPVVVTTDGVSNRVAPAVLPDGTLLTVHNVTGGLNRAEPSCQFPVRSVVTRWARNGKRLRSTDALVSCSDTGGVPPATATHVPILDSAITADPVTGDVVVAAPTTGSELGGVLVAQSADGGNTWQRSVVQSAPGRSASMVSASAMGGQVALAWLDFQGAGIYWPVVAGSRDGGRSWSAPVPVASLPSVGSTRPVTPVDRYTIGHYMGVALGTDGVAHVAWPDMRPDGTGTQDPDVFVRPVAIS
jgi:hypothetical protein